METDWKVILAIALAAVMQSVAYAIREWANGKSRSRMESKIDGNTALTATTLVSSGNLPVSAPCIPAVAKAVSSDAKTCASAVDYATLATGVARDTMTREGIPVQSHDLLLSKLHSLIIDTQKQAEETKLKEERHATNNASWIKVLQDELQRLKTDVGELKAKSPDAPPSV